MKRIFAILSVLLVLLALLTACNTNPSLDPADSAITTASPETAAQTEQLVIVKDGIANYRIVRAEEAEASTVNAASRLCTLINQETGVLLDMSTDWVKRGTELDHESLEILVGHTAYEESTQALKGLAYGDYIVTHIGNKLVINAWSAEGLRAGVSALAQKLYTHAEAGNFSLPADIHIVGTEIKLANELPVYTGGNVRTIYHCGDNNQMLIIDNTNPIEYAAYRSTLESAGYTLYTENDIAGNQFSTYINDKYVINAGYYAYESASRMIIEPRTTLPKLESENQYTKIMEPSFAMLGLEFPESDGEITPNGLCFVFQLADGSYIIIDGGLYRDQDTQALFDYLYTYAPDKDNITIAAWILTHGHGDHNGTWLKFTEIYANRVNLELMIANFPSDEACTEVVSGASGASGTKSMNYVKKYKGAEFIKTHVGHTFFIRDAKIEMLYTAESYAPAILDHYNTSSLIFTVEIAGQKFNILADATHYACDIAHKMYGDYLKADFVQTAHHGMATGPDTYYGVTDVYTKSAAPVVLWPCGDAAYESMHKRVYSAYLQDLSTTKEIFVAGSRVIRLPLPYTYGTSEYETILK